MRWTAGELRTASVYNYNGLSQFPVGIVASNGILSATLVCQVTVIFVPEPPTVSGFTFAVTRDAAFPLKYLGQITAVDHDPGEFVASLCCWQFLLGIIAVHAALCRRDAGV